MQKSPGNYLSLRSFHHFIIHYKQISFVSDVSRKWMILYFLITVLLGFFLIYDGPLLFRSFNRRSILVDDMNVSSFSVTLPIELDGKVNVK
jgi:hypothetical protein